MGMKDKPSQKQGQAKQKPGQAGQQPQRGQQQGQRGQQQPGRGRENLRDIQDTEQEMRDRLDQDYDA